MVTDYRTIFDAVESTLVRVGSQVLPESEIRGRLDMYKKVAGRRLSDADAYRILVEVVFYSGFRAATVSDRLDVIHGHLPDYQTVARYVEDDVQRILADPRMISHAGKVRACVENAQTMERLVREHGSFQAYVDTFAPTASEENLLRLKQALQYRFRYLGRVTVYHFLMELGLPVLKPDRVICRIFYRLGLVEHESDSEDVVAHGKRFAAATGHPIRYIDIVFVAYGQAEFKEFGLDTGICLTDYPRCDICGVRKQCVRSPIL